jgi:VanZ family protein
VSGRTARLTIVLVLLAMALMSLGPVPQPDLPGTLELLPHVGAYALGTYLLLRVVHRAREAPTDPAKVTLVAAAMVALGVAMELAQRVVDRNVEIADVFADAVGVAVAAAVWSLVRRPHGSASDRGR